MAKTKLTVYIPEELAARVKATVIALQGPPHLLTLADVAEAALAAEVARLEKDHNQGKPYPPFAGRRRPGRPLGSRNES